MTPQVMLVAGGSHGVGAAIVRLAAQRGYDVAFTHEGDARAESVVDAVHASGRRSLDIRADMRNEIEVAGAFEATVSELSSIDSFVYSSETTALPSRLVDTDWSELRRVIDANLLGALFACREACKHMSTERGGRGGSIVLIGSRASYYGNPGRGIAYGISKAGLDALNYGLGKEVASQGIRVNLLAPASIQTEENDLAENYDTPMGRPGQPEEVAKAALFLAGGESSFVSAANIIVSGAL